MFLIPTFNNVWFVAIGALLFGPVHIPLRVIGKLKHDSLYSTLHSRNISDAIGLMGFGLLLITLTEVGADTVTQINGEESLLL